VPDTHKNSYTLVFIIVTSVICSVVIALSVLILRDRQLENIALDKKKNILSASGIVKKGSRLKRVDILKLYDEKIKSRVINTAGQVVKNKMAEKLDPRKDVGFLPLYYMEKDRRVHAYIIPISGKGLWSTIYGYLALKADAITVKGITFYQHGETPGLGGEIEKDWFTNSFVGKRIVTTDKVFVSVRIARGKVKGKVAESKLDHYVDGISGATMTTRGLDKFLKENLLSYEPYFKRIRQSYKDQ